jgi:two-component system sensor histidine kinase/response regulator
MVRAGSFDLVFMDMQMPVMDGVRCTRAIRRIERLARLPIVAMTANAMQQDRQQCLDAGMNAVVVKPIDPEVLLATLVEWVPRAALRVRAAPAIAAPAARSSHEETGLPPIQGLDTEVGLRHVMNRKPLYLDLLRRFAAQFGSTAAQIREAASAGDLDAAERVAHSARSVAANIGATGVQAVAQSVEDAIRERRPGSEVRLRLRDLERELAYLIAGIGAALPAIAACDLRDAADEPGGTAAVLHGCGLQVPSK